LRKSRRAAEFRGACLFDATEDHDLDEVYRDVVLSGKLRRFELPVVEAGDR
jgi:hypothetical protein